MPAKYWTPQLVLARLHEVHRTGRSMRHSDLRPTHEGLLTAARNHYGSYYQALAVAGIPIPQQLEVWSKERIIAELQQLERDGQSLKYKDMRRTHRKLLPAALKRFGGYRGALQAAGIDPDTVLKCRQHTRESIVQALRLRQREGKNMMPAAIRHDDAGLYAACYQLFGSPRGALQAAGIDPEPLCRTKWTRQTILSELQRLHREEKLSGGQAPKKLTDSACRYFGSYQKALEAAGINYEAVVRQSTSWTPCRVLEELRLAHRQGISLWRLVKLNHGLVGAARRHYGSYLKAVEAAGIKHTGRMTWTPERVIAELQRHHRSGRLSESKDSIRSLMNGARNRFGSYRKALEAAGIDPAVGYASRWKKASTSWSPASIIAQLQELHAAGQDLRLRTMKVKHMPLFFAAKDLFGSYMNALKEAQIDYNAVVHRALDTPARRALRGGVPSTP